MAPNWLFAMSLLQPIAAHDAWSRGRTADSYALRLVFFFSSRRRHTRLVSDWSSDVCSSDLDAHIAPVDGMANAALVELLSKALKISRRNVCIVSGNSSRTKVVEISGVDLESEIGRASCRERV